MAKLSWWERREREKLRRERRKAIRETETLKGRLGLEKQLYETKRKRLAYQQALRGIRKQKQQERKEQWDKYGKPVGKALGGFAKAGYKGVKGFVKWWKETPTTPRRKRY
jgi:hypothetical protein